MKHPNSLGTLQQEPRPSSTTSDASSLTLAGYSDAEHGRRAVFGNLRQDRYSWMVEDVFEALSDVISNHATIYRHRRC